MRRQNCTALAVFAKAPLAGRVKTRLADRLSPEQAARFHGECVRATWERFAAMSGIDAFLYCDRCWPAFEELAGRERFRIQRGRGLGGRMRCCLDEMHGQGYGCAVIVGSDAPTLPAGQVREALDGLCRVEVVLGPATDGGFTLIAATRTAPEMFAGVRWSRDDTLSSCVRAVEAARLSVATTRTTAYDVDTPADLERLRNDPELPQCLRAWFAGTVHRSERLVPARRTQGFQYGRDML